MARIRWIEESEATGEIAEVYASWMAANPGREKIPGILKCLGLQPGLFRKMDEVSDLVHFRDAHLPVRIKEMIATYVSALNRCPYCTGSHAFFLQSEDPDPKLHTGLALADLGSAPMPEAERALLDFVGRVTRESYKTSDADVEKLRSLGWSDPQIAECVYVTALFAFFNRVANAFGLEDPNYFDNPPPRKANPLPR